MPAELFTFGAYVVSVIDPKRICVRVDKDKIELVSTRISEATDRTTFKDTIVVDVSSAKYSITAFDWAELSDLVGAHIKVKARLRKYSFWRVRATPENASRNQYRSVNQKGVSVIADTISSDS